MSVINYRESYFQHPSLTKISGEPTYKSLAKLERECKANGKSVRSTLGGGLQGHLGLVCNATTYNRVSPGVPFNRPILPVLPDLTQATAPQIAAARQLYADNIATFQACNLVERTIIQQINTALDEDCLADLIDDDTGLLVGTIPQILQSLFDTYGAITPQSLATAKAKVEASTYNHARPIVNIFTAINEYANMADAAQAAETPTQLINIGIIIITRSTIFSSDIRKWHDKQEDAKTWPNFKDHFKAAQKAIKRSQPTVTTDSLGFHEQANATESIAGDQPTAASIVTQVLDRISTQRDDASVITAESIAEQQMQQQIFHMANSTQQNQQMLEQMTALATTVATLQSQVNSHNQNQGQGGGRPRGHGRGRDRNGGRGGRGGARRVFKYCWTHGNCSHGSADCEAPTDGHLKCATYTNMQGGSTYRCHWLTS
jgi:hypothetical protein